MEGSRGGIQSAQRHAELGKNYRQAHKVFNYRLYDVQRDGENPFGFKNSSVVRKAILEGKERPALNICQTYIYQAIQFCVMDFFRLMGDHSRLGEHE